MSDAPRRTLRELIDRHGPGLCSDARRCEGLLRDMCGEHRREINILVGALRERVPLDLLAARNSVPAGMLLTRLSKRLEDQLALTEAASRWAVDSWALALGVVSEAELAEIKSRHEESTSSRAGTTPPPPAPPRTKAEDEARAGRPAASSGAGPPTQPPRAQQSPPPPAPAPPASNPPGPRSPPPRAARPTAQASPAAPARRQAAPPAARPPAPAQTVNAGGLQEPSTNVAPRSRRGRWRGCLFGCFLILLLSALLVAGGPFVINLLREEQQERNFEPAPVQTR